MICVFWCLAWPDVKTIVGLPPAEEVIGIICGAVSLEPCPSMLFLLANKKYFCCCVACALLGVQCCSQFLAPCIYNHDTSLGTCHFLSDSTPATCSHHSEAIFMVIHCTCYGFIGRNIMLIMVATACSRVLHEVGTAHLVGALLSSLRWLTQRKV